MKNPAAKKRARSLVYGVPLSLIAVALAVAFLAQDCCGCAGCACPPLTCNTCIGGSRGWCKLPGGTGECLPNPQACEQKKGEWLGSRNLCCEGASPTDCGQMADVCHVVGGVCMEGSAAPIKACTTYTADECETDEDAKKRCAVCADANGIKSCQDLTAPCNCPKRCPTGCCDAKGVCQTAASSMATCGSGGKACVACGELTADRCTNGECRCGANAECGANQWCNDNDACQAFPTCPSGYKICIALCEPVCWDATMACPADPCP